MPLKVYLDLPILGGLLGWIQDATLLWMVAQITIIKVPWRRLIAGGLIGGLFQAVLLINQATSGLIMQWILSPVLFMVVVPFLMIGISFFPVKPVKLLQTVGYFYLLSFLLSGFHWGIDSLNQRFLQWEISLWWRFWLHLMLIFVLGELGWGVVHRKIWEQICLFPIEVSWETEQLKINALLDTGNRLYDPLTRIPVVIIEFDVLKNKLPNEVISFIEQLQQGSLGNDCSLPKYWEQRFRVLPFNSIGKQHGILVGFRPESLRIWQKQQEFIHQNVVIAISKHGLSPEGAFQALIPPSLLRVSNLE